MTVDLSSLAKVYNCTSDRYFRDIDEGLRADEVEGFDLAFIDGMHLFEYALRDFINLEKRSHADSIIVIDDVLPLHCAQAERQRRTQVWTGDVWKLIDLLQTLRTDLTITLLDTAPTGVAVISDLDKFNKLLTQQYNPLVRHHLAEERDLPKEILERCGAIDPDDFCF